MVHSSSQRCFSALMCAAFIHAQLFELLDLLLYLIFVLLMTQFGPSFSYGTDILILVHRGVHSVTVRGLNPHPAQTLGVRCLCRYAWICVSWANISSLVCKKGRRSFANLSCAAMNFDLLPEPWTVWMELLGFLHGLTTNSQKLCFYKVLLMIN